MGRNHSYTGALLVGQAIVMSLLLAGNWHPVRAAVYVAIFVATAVALIAMDRRHSRAEITDETVGAAAPPVASAVPPGA
ncbi:hypothetical protein [Nocardia arthritidis]|uniref:Uncharacterized protein n=1 Tax=Nocardia arthritidis TaxID=228602 RepID=A0A6G9YRZ2_9NOCA|nr:hypothetical protein [Nocardia arthritidis]QIS15890.1 hypothetical protein F5544_40370 [Nocardia arthritidis]